MTEVSAKEKLLTQYDTLIRNCLKEKSNLDDIWNRFFNLLENHPHDSDAYILASCLTDVIKTHCLNDEPQSDRQVLKLFKILKKQTNILQNDKAIDAYISMLKNIVILSPKTRKRFMKFFRKYMRKTELLFVKLL